MLGAAVSVREETDRYAEEYARRQGIEGTVSWAVRACGLRRARYRGLEKVRLDHALVATALNYVRAGGWFSGAPRPTVRSSPFAALMGDTEAA